MEKILLFGDSWGVPQLVRHLPPKRICGIVGAEIRTQYQAELKALADSLQVAFLVQARKDSESYPSFVEKVRILSPDLIVVNSYSMLLHPEILLIPRAGCINIHSALLPKYRGSNPLQWAIINNETETGVTMHYMTADFDAGDIIAQHRVPIGFNDTWLDLQTRCAAATEAMLEQEIGKILSETNDRRTQDETMATHSRRRRPEDGLIDWQQSVIGIHNLVRALVQPLPGAFYYADAAKIVLDEYLFVPEIVALKYAADAGGRKLRSEHIDLVPLRLSDLSRAHGLLEGFDDTPLEGADPHAVLAHLRRRNDRVVFVVHSREADEPAGWIWLDNIDYVKRAAQLNIRMNPRLLTGNLEKETVALMLSFAFDELKLENITPSRSIEG